MLSLRMTCKYEFNSEETDCNVVFVSPSGGKIFCNWNASRKEQRLVSILPTPRIRRLMARERLKI